MSGLVSENDVSQLGSIGLRRIVNALLLAEASRANVPLNKLDLTLRDSAPDAGIDGQIDWPDITHDYLRSGLNALQYKSGKLSPAGLKAEFLKPGVQDVLNRGGHYVLVLSEPYVATTKSRKRTELETLCSDEGFSASQGIIVFADELTRWICSHPGVAIMRDLGRGYPGFVTVEGWSVSRILSNPYTPDAARSEVMSAIRNFVKAVSVTEATLRIEGPAGVGKTRLVLEALKEPGLRESSIYNPNAADTSASQLLTAIQGNPEATCIIVLDECELDQQQVLESYSRLAEGRIRLICVGVADVLFSARPAQGRVYQIEVLEEEFIRKILLDAVSDLPAEIVDTAVRLSEGYVKLAIFIAQELLENPQLPLTSLRQLGDVRQFLKRYLDDSTRRALQTLALLTKIGWEEELQVEARSVAEIVESSFTDLQTAVFKLRQKGVVLSRGRYLYLSPEILAISAAADLWDERGADLIAAVEKLPGSEARRQLLRRLATMSDHPNVRSALERLLSNQGLFKTIVELNKDFPSEVFRLLSSALPGCAVETLERLLNPASKDDLLNFTVGRREVMWALESLLRWPETSLRAAKILLNLAIAENESIGNSASGIVTQYFHPHLSGSPVPLEERLGIVWDLIQSSDIGARLVGVRAAAACLDFHESRMGGEQDSISGKRFPAEWRPKTWGELWSARLLAIQQLESVSKGDDEAAALARKELTNGIYALRRDGQLSEAVGVVDRIEPKNDEEQRGKLDAANRLLKDSKADLKSGELETLYRIVGSAFGNEYLDQLKRWVGKRLHSDYDLEGKTGYAKADKKVEELATIGFRDGISKESLAWLSSENAENVWLFGKTLGSLDSRRAYLPQIAELAPRNFNCILLSSYFVGISEKEGTDARDDLIDQLENNCPILAFVCSLRGDATVRSGERVVRLMQSGLIDTSFYRFLMYGGWVEAQPATIGSQIVDQLLKDDNEAGVEPAISILHHHCRKNVDRLEVLEPLVWKALSTKNALPMHAEWDWSELAKIAIPYSPEKVAQLSLDRIRLDDSVWISGSPVVQIIAEATKAGVNSVWPIVGEELLKQEIHAYRLLLALENWYGELIPVETLVEWAKMHGPKAITIAARLLVLGTAPLSGHTRALISAFPDNEDILHQMAGAVGSGVWVGQMSEWIKSRIATVRQWENDPDKRISDFAKSLAANYEKELRRQLVREEEQSE